MKVGIEGPEWNNAAYEVKKRKILLFHTPITGLHQYSLSSQPYGRKGTLERKKEPHIEVKNKIR